MVGWRIVPFWCFVNIHPCSLLCKIFHKAETWLEARGKPEGGRGGVGGQEMGRAGLEAEPWPLA